MADETTTDLGMRPMMEFGIGLYERMMRNAGLPVEWEPGMTLEDKAAIAGLALLESLSESE